MSKHTPTPWLRGEEHESKVLITDTKESPVLAIRGGPQMEDNAHFVLTACNAYDSLVEALEEIDALEEECFFGCTRCGHEESCKGSDVQLVARRALKLARGDK